MTDRTSGGKHAFCDIDLATVMDARCMQCGCTDSIACPGGCGWVWVDRKRGVGVCDSHDSYTDRRRGLAHEDGLEVPAL